MAKNFSVLLRLIKLCEVLRWTCLGNDNENDPPNFPTHRCCRPDLQMAVPQRQARLGRLSETWEDGKLLLNCEFALRFMRWTRCVGEVLVGSGSSCGGKHHRAAADHEGLSWSLRLNTDIRRQIEVFRATLELSSASYQDREPKFVNINQALLLLTDPQNACWL